MSSKTRKPATAPKPAHPRPALGRGLGALIGAPAEPAPAAHEPAANAAGDDRRVLLLPVAEIARSPWQPRQVFDPEALRELADSIRAHGVIQPLLCRRAATGQGFELIAGERRLRAAIEAGIGQVPVILIDAVDRDAAELAIIENIQREDLNVIEEAEGYRTLADAFSLTQQEVAERVGKARASVANALRLLELPDEIRQLLSAGQLSAGHAKLLLAVPEEKDQLLLARKCVTEGQTVRALERLIQRRQGPQKERSETQPDIPESHRRHLLDLLHTRFGTQVRLTPSLSHANGKHAKGAIEIDFYDNDELDRLLGLLGIVLE